MSDHPDWEYLYRCADARANRAEARVVELEKILNEALPMDHPDVEETPKSVLRRRALQHPDAEEGA